MSVFSLFCRSAVILLAIGAAPSAWAAFNDDRGKQWRGQCTAGQSKYTCCKNAELDCRDDCGALQQCKNDCSSSYSACTKGMVVVPGGVVAPGITGGGAVLDPGPSASPGGGKFAPRATGRGVLAPK